MHESCPKKLWTNEVIYLSKKTEKFKIKTTDNKIMWAAKISRCARLKRKNNDILDNKLILFVKIPNDKIEINRTDL